MSSTRKPVRSRSPSPAKGRSSRSKSPQHKQHSILKKGNRSTQRQADELVAGDEDMETRSRKRKANLKAIVEPQNTSTPRSKRTSARTRLALKQEPLDDSSFATKPTTEATVKFNDTPAHLYGKKYKWFCLLWKLFLSIKEYTKQL